MLKKLHSYFRPAVCDDSDWGVCRPHRQNGLMSRIFNPRLDTFHVERTPSGKYAEFCGGYAPGQHITGLLSGGPEGWFKYDRIDAAPAHRALIPAVNVNLGFTRLKAAKTTTLGCKQSLEDAGQPAIDQLVARYGLQHLPVADRTNPTSPELDRNDDRDIDAKIQRLRARQCDGLRESSRFDQVMPALARAALAQARPDLAEATVMPAMFLGRTRLRDTGSVNGRLNVYRAVEATFLSIQLTPEANDDGWKAALKNPTDADLAAPREAHGWLHVPVFARTKVLEDGRLLSHSVTPAAPALPAVTPPASPPPAPAAC